MKLRSIYAKFMISIILILGIFSTIILIVVSNMLTTTYESKVLQDNAETTNSISEIVGSFMDKAYAITEELATSDAILSMDGTIQAPILKNTASRNDYFELIYIQDANGDQTARSAGELGNRASRWWFSQTMEEKQPFISKSYYSVSTNMTCASIFYPLYQGNQIIGIFATDIKLSTLQALVEKYSDLSNGKIAYIIDGEGNVIAHPVSVYFEELYNYKNLTRTVTKVDGNGNAIKDENGNILTEDLSISITPEYASMISTAISGAQGTAEITDQGVTYYASYQPISLQGNSDSWTIITLQDKEKALSIIDHVKNTVVLIALLVVVLAILIFSYITQSITKPIKLCLNRIRLLSEGDLTTTVPAVKNHDESAELLNNLNRTIDTLQSIIAEINHFAEEIANGDFRNTMHQEYSGEFAALAQSLATIAESTKHTMQKINTYSEDFVKGTDFFDATAASLADGTSSQAAAIEELSATLTDISSKLRENANDSSTANELMSSVASDLSKNEQYLNSLVSAMNMIEQNSQNISGISKTMQNIATQTHLLSLNASVEASRAGEAGRAFAVIVYEIRELSNKCSEAANNTSALIELTNKSVTEGIEQLNITVSSMNQISHKNIDAGNLISNINRATDQQAEAIEQISTAIEQISEIVQTNSLSAEQNAQKSSDMKQSVQKLKNMLQKYHF